MAKLADASDLGSGAERRGGSNPLRVILDYRPLWRNWQTRLTQNQVLAREWRFKSSQGHFRPSSTILADAATSKLQEGVLSNKQYF